MKKLIIILSLCPFIAISQFAINIPPSNVTQASVLDNDGNVFVSAVYGTNESFDFDRKDQEFVVPIYATPYIASYNQNGDLRFAFILEDLSPNQLGTFNQTTQQTLLIDNQSNIYLIGIMSGWVDFDPGNGVNAIQTANLGENHGYIASYDKDGNFRFVHDLGRTSNNKIYADISPNGDIALTYSLRGATNINGETVGDSTIGGSYYLLSIDSSGNLNWFYSFLTKSTLNTNTAARLNVDDFGNIYLMNVLFDDIDLDPGVGFVDLGVSQLDDRSYYIASYTPNGALRYTHKLSENFQSGFLHTYDFEIDNQENVYVYGPFSGTINFEAQGDFQLTSAVGTDMFLVSYNSNGQVRYGHSLGFLGSTTFDGSEARPLFSDILPDGRLLLSGWFTGDKDFDPGSGQLKIERNGDFAHTFITVYDINGNIDNAYGFLTDGSAGSIPWGMNTNDKGQILMNGFFYSKTDFNPNSGETFLEVTDSENYLTLLNNNFSISTSIKSILSTPPINLFTFPNPATSLLNIQFKKPTEEPLQIKLINNLGRVVLSERITRGDLLHSIDIDHLYSGAYFLLVEGNSFRDSQLIVKK